MTDERSSRAAFQVLVLPYRHTDDGLQYALFRRSDAAYWQGVAGGGEVGESPFEAARREAAEEAGLIGDHEFVALDARATIPVVFVTGEFTWGPDVLVIPEYAFGARADGLGLILSGEHTEYGWFTVDDAAKAVQWDSNRTALWELDHRLRHGKSSGLDQSRRRWAMSISSRSSSRSAPADGGSSSPARTASFAAARAVRG